jgi:uncharacterized protein (DUF433 family)
LPAFIGWSKVIWLELPDGAIIRGKGGIMQANWRDHIVSTTDVLRGKPRIKGTRIPVSLVLGYLAAGKTTQEIREEFPDLTEEQIAACLDYARELAEFEVVTA